MNCIMTRTIYLIFFLSFFYNVLTAQQAISSFGTIQTNGGLILNATMGEFAIDTKMNANTLLTEGFHQPYLLPTAIKDISDSEIEIYPNPVIDFIHIVFEEDAKEKQINICDLTGRVLIQKISNQSSITLNLGSLIGGLFTLNITDTETKRTQVTKIIKL